MSVILKAHCNSALAFGEVVDMPSPNTYRVELSDGKVVVVHDSLIKKFYM